MSDVNMVQLIGRLGADPEMKYTASGGAIANLRLATGKKWKDKQTGESKESTEWHRVVFFNRQAEVCGEYLKKGSHVYIRGSIRTRKWQDKDGQDRYTTEIVGDEMNMLGSAGAQPAQSAQSTPATAPQQQGFRDPAPAAPEDDIPF